MEALTARPSVVGGAWRRSGTDGKKAGS